MKSISIRFALASVCVALLILALTGSINYIFLKDELLHDAANKAKLIEKNSRYQIDSLIIKTKETSLRLEKIFEENGFDEENIRKTLTKVLKDENSFFGSTIAFEPNLLVKKPFSPYFYKKNSTILYTNLAQNGYDYLHKDWYILPKKRHTSLWSEPYFDKGGGNVLMATYSNPLYHNKKFIGVLTIDLSLKKIQEVVSSIEVLDSGYAFILSKNGKILGHPQKSQIMKQYKDPSFVYNEMIKEKDFWIYYSHIENTDFTLAIVFPVKELFSSLHYMSLVSIILAILGSILLIITMIIISKRVSEPLRELTLLTEDISKGNFDKKLTLPKSKDEIYQLSLAINTMQEAIKNYICDLKTATVKEQRVKSELDIARKIQMSMLPCGIEENENLNIYALLKPAKEVGGDFYNFFHIDENHICFVVADVSGKGIPAAMFMSVSMSYIKAYTTKNISACEIIEKLNDTIASNNDANMFVTLFLGILNIYSGKLNYVNAGHNEPYLLSTNKKNHKLLSSKNPVVGALEGLTYKEEFLYLSEGDKLFLYTDGVTEAFSKKDEQYGEKRLKTFLDTHNSSDITQATHLLEESIQNFCIDCEQSDDITMLYLEFKKKKDL
jgi:phosphoserine phosphatase RsbU/P